MARHIMRPGRTHPKAATGREDGKGPTSFHTHHPIWEHQRAFRNPTEPTKRRSVIDRKYNDCILVIPQSCNRGAVLDIYTFLSKNYMNPMME